MEAGALRETAMRVAAALPAVRAGQPFGEAFDVFTVVGRVFAIVSDRSDQPDGTVLTLKCAPPHAAALVADHPAIIPGYHMNKRHWISIRPHDRVTEDLVEDLVANSWELVVAGLPRAARPLDPMRGARAEPDPATD